ncbi:hypothetical protein [Isoptericola sp. AK164]|uniref:AMIN-like domain-containing (lipo)protein n=1 Tax=Isoptericola sp. AK164 TaxID=3024246 RepID=UPI002418390C|nr:hypothetical protein [Isoptericola sp. AK164]
MQRSPHRRRTVGAVALVAGAALLAACGDGDGLPGYGGGAPATESSSPTAASSAPEDEETPTEEPTDEATDEPTDDATPTEPETPFEGGTALDESAASDDALLTVTDVRVGSHDGYDRVVFDLEGTGTPGWRAQYVEAALEPGRGEELDVGGDSVLEVGITGTGYPTDTGVTEYDGDPVAGPGGSVEEVVYSFVFEGTTTAFVGVDGEPRPFRVFSLKDPTRVVVDVGS